MSEFAGPGRLGEQAFRSFRDCHADRCGRLRASASAVGATVASPASSGRLRARASATGPSQRLADLLPAARPALERNPSRFLAFITLTDTITCYKKLTKLIT